MDCWTPESERSYQIKKLKIAIEIPETTVEIIGLPNTAPFCATTSKRLRGCCPDHLNTVLPVLLIALPSQAQESTDRSTEGYYFYFRRPFQLEEDSGISSFQKLPRFTVRDPNQLTRPPTARLPRPTRALPGRSGVFAPAWSQPPGVCTVPSSNPPTLFPPPAFRTFMLGYVATRFCLYSEPLPSRRLRSGATWPGLSPPHASISLAVCRAVILSSPPVAPLAPRPRCVQVDIALLLWWPPNDELIQDAAAVAQERRQGARGGCRGCDDPVLPADPGRYTGGRTAPQHQAPSQGTPQRPNRVT